MALARDPNFGKVISKSTGMMFWWDKRDPLPVGNDLYWVDVPPDVHEIKVVKATAEPDKSEGSKGEKK